MSKQFWGVIIIIVLVFVGIFALSGNKSNGSKGSSSSSSSALSEHKEGNNTTGVTLVEYGDYQCPYCGQYYPVVKQVQAEFNNQITFQFRNFPLVNVHQNAFAGARAAEAASLQDKFWEMHDALYETQTQWSTSTDPESYFTQIAQQLGLNVTQFQSDYASGKVNDVINADMAEGNKLGIQGTPTFFLNGKQIQVGETASSFETLIKAAIAKQAVTSSGKTSQTTQTTPATKN